MDEKEKEEAERKAAEETEAKAKAPGTDDLKDGNPPETEAEGSPDKIELANQASERLEKATASQKKENDRTDKIQASIIASGKGQMVPATQKAKETDEEYAERFKRGEVNPLKDDGIK